MTTYAFSVVKPNAQIWQTIPSLNLLTVTWKKASSSPRGSILSLTWRLSLDGPCIAFIQWTMWPWAATYQPSGPPAPTNQMILKSGGWWVINREWWVIRRWVMSHQEAGDDSSVGEHCLKLLPALLALFHLDSSSCFLSPAVRSWTEAFWACQTG